VRLLLDTHLVLWWEAGSPKLPLDSNLASRVNHPLLRCSSLNLGTLSRRGRRCGIRRLRGGRRSSIPAIGSVSRCRCPRLPGKRSIHCGTVPIGRTSCGLNRVVFSSCSSAPRRPAEQCRPRLGRSPQRRLLQRQSLQRKWPRRRSNRSFAPLPRPPGRGSIGSSSTAI